MNGVGDHPEIPGTIAQCEWCGSLVYTYTDTELNFCPNCHHGTLRDDCPHCHAPIAFPPQLNCLQCGESFTIIKLQPVVGGLGAVTIVEPDAKRRAELEIKGNHWHDVVRGNSEGPDLPPLKVSPPPGWTKEAFDRILRAAKVDAGEDMTRVEKELNSTATQVCEKCNLTFILPENETAIKTCPFCQSPIAPPNSTGESGVDNSAPPS